MRPLAFAARSLRREFRHAELATLAAALVLAVAALTAVATLASRVEHALIASAADLIGGDLGIGASRALPPAFAAQANERGLQTNVLADFPSVAFAGEKSRLCDIRASDEAFPLRGALTIIDTGGHETPAHAPSAGTVYVDHAVLAALDVSIGATLQLGGRDLVIGGEISKSPDGGNLFRIAPRILMNLTDAQDVGLLGPGSRARHRMLVSGSERAVAAFASWAKPQLPDGAEITTVEDAQQNLRSAFERGESFLRLAALLAALLSGVAIALAAQRFARRKIEEVALLRCLGASRGEIVSALFLELVLLALPACAAGLVLGLVLQQVVLSLASGLLPGATPAVPWGPPIAAFAVGLAVLFGFALPPLLRLRDVEPMRLFRRDLVTRVRRVDVLYLLPVAVGALLILLGAGNVRLAATLAAGFAGVAVATLLLGLALLSVVRIASLRLRGALRFGLANLARRRMLTLIQAGALALSLTALALLGVVGPSLLAHWRAELPTDTPNWFMINLQPEQVAPIEQRLQELHASSVNLLPLASGKLVAINGKIPDEKSYDDRRASGAISGEVRVSWSTALPPSNKLVEGSWFGTSTSKPQLSVDQMWIDMFHLKLGDTLTVRVGEKELEATITSIRHVDWTSFRANFFLMLDPASAAALPHAFVASFHLDGANALASLSRDFPNVSLIDLNAILDRVRDIIDRVTRAVTSVLGFSLLAGVLVLLAALASTADERRFESALLRTLGAHRRQLSIAVLSEFAVLGLLAGSIAVIGSGVLGTVLAREVFRMPDYTPPLGALAALVAAAAAIVALAGWAGTLRISRTSPMAVLRSG
ncbi:MAG: FtsX-like permease family protein [Dokdonella sp.]|uniref:ABC transporter permease n=1 Tax=Dokdonella sp. TaxID=2291710 RepID=UPI0032642F3A